MIRQIWRVCDGDECCRSWRATAGVLVRPMMCECGGIFRPVSWQRSDAFNAAVLLGGTTAGIAAVEAYKAARKSKP